MKKSYAVICLSTAIMLTACGPKGNDRIESTGVSIESSEETKAQPSRTTDTEVLYQRENKRQDSHKAIVKEYDLGERSYTAQSGKSMPYRVRGVAGVPEEDGIYPLVLITHGSHSNEDESKRFDTGFTYLAEALARQGYVVVAMDMSSPYLWKYGDGDDKEKSIAVAKEQIHAIKSCSEGEMEFPVDLRDKIDWEQVSLIGHSRGGDTIFDIAVSQEKEGLSIASLFSIAPAMPAEVETREMLDIPTAILVPEYDGDVVSLDGFAIQSVLEERNDKPSVVTMLKGANHNYFNTNLTTNDGLLARSEEQLVNQLDAETQREFLVSYTLDFLEGILFDKNELQPNRMYGQDVVNRTTYGTDQVLVRAGNPEEWKAEGATATPVVDSWFYEMDQISADTITFGEGNKKEKKLMDIQWEQKGGSVSFQPGITDLSSHTMLTMYLLTNPADEKNQAVEYQDFSITLTDKDGNEATVTLNDMRNSLKKPDGKLDATPIYEKEIQFWSVPTPITATSIPLKLFAGVNRAQIETVTLNLDQTDAGGIYLEKVVAQ